MKPRKTSEMQPGDGGPSAPSDDPAGTFDGGPPLGDLLRREE
jgi:hypothetical protein